jgi:acyl-CoA dehydrogenase
VAKLLIAPSASRDRLTAECYLPLSENEPVGAIELALKATLEAEPIEAKIRAAEKNGRFDNNPRANVRDIAIVAFEALDTCDSLNVTTSREAPLMTILFRS